jgi:hypothetical protein
MTSAITMRPEMILDITTYWLVVDGDNVGTFAPNPTCPRVTCGAVDVAHQLPDDGHA